MNSEELSKLVGTDLGYSDWCGIDQRRIDSLADCTDDHQFIHVDQLKASATPFGGTVAHGFLTLSLLTALCADLLPKLEGASMMLNYGFDKVRFLAPVPAGASVRAGMKLADVSARNTGQVLLTCQVTVEIKDTQKPALVADWLTMAVLQ